jgi:hypothetical protein
MSRPDAIYQLTLTELAFVVIFLILLLTGWMVVKSEDDKAAALAERDAALARAAELATHVEAPEQMEQLRQALEQTKADILNTLTRHGAAHPGELLSKLVEKTQAEAENQRLKQRIADLDAQLSALAEIQNAIAAAAQTNGDTAAARDQARNEALSALSFKQALEQAAGEPVPRHREQETAQAYAQARKDARAAASGQGEGAPDVARENQDLRGQVAWMRQRLEANGGRDYPPCWADPVTGKPQYLLSIVIQEGGLGITPAWPPERGSDAARLPGIDGLANAGALSLGTFQARARPLDQDSRAHNCRHYVRLLNRAKSLESFNRYRYAVEEFFYKFEVR